MLRENKTVIALSAQLGSLYACSGTLRGLLDGEGLPGDQLPPLVGNIILLVLCSMWTVWNLSFEPELERRRKNMTIELRYMLAQLILAGLSVWGWQGLRCRWPACVSIWRLSTQSTWAAICGGQGRGQRVGATKNKRRARGLQIAGPSLYE